MPESLTLRLWCWALLGAIAAATVACQSKPWDDETVTVAGNDAGAGGGPAEPIQIQVLGRIHVSSDADADHFQHASAAVDFGNREVESATLKVTLESPCFPFAKWADPAVPAGQRWPEACNAFDRTLSVALDEVRTAPPAWSCCGRSRRSADRSRSRPT